MVSMFAFKYNLYHYTEVLSVLSELAVDTPRRAATHMVTIHEI
jgi:hypothetical protein